MKINFNPAYKQVYSPFHTTANNQIQSTDSTSAMEETQSTQENSSTDSVSSSSSVNSSDQTSEAPKTPPEVAAFMMKIGLQPTNSKEGDLAAVTSRLDMLESQATSADQKAIIQGYRSEFAQLTGASTGGGTPSTQDPKQQNAMMSGLDHLAAMNKAFFYSSLKTETV